MIKVEDKIKSRLKEVIDPELRINIVDLGLVYGVAFDGGVATVTMTLTFPGCPLSFIIEEAVRQYVSSLKEVKEVKLEIVWEPPWSVEKIHPEIRAQYGIKI
jgi:metal-sulfur cluster biosynthetic enzyme